MAVGLRQDRGMPKTLKLAVKLALEMKADAIRQNKH